MWEREIKNDPQFFRLTGQIESSTEMGNTGERAGWGGEWSGELSLDTLGLRSQWHMQMETLCRLFWIKGGLDKRPGWRREFRSYWCIWDLSSITREMRRDKEGERSEDGGLGTLMLRSLYEDDDPGKKAERSSQKSRSRYRKGSFPGGNPLLYQIG